MKRLSKLRPLWQHFRQTSRLSHLSRQGETSRTKVIPDYLTPMPSHLLTTTLSDLLGNKSITSSPRVQDPPRVLPQGHHLVYFPIQAAPSDLAPDGADLDHSPGPKEFPRRLWAGGRVDFRPGWRENLVLDGRCCICQEEIGIARRDSSTALVDVWRRYGAQGSAWDVEERRTLVFTNETQRTPQARKFPHKPTFSTRTIPRYSHLFHFSALSYNAHAIHLNPLFARGDGHRDILVHGPLTLALMLNLLGDRVVEITYRNYMPLYVDESMTICVREPQKGSPGGSSFWDVWIEGPEGHLAVKGTALLDEHGDTR